MVVVVGRSPQGERGLKWCEVGACGVVGGRSPPGERGLKYFDTRPFERVRAVALLMESVD